MLDITRLKETEENSRPRRDVIAIFSKALPAATSCAKLSPMNPGNRSITSISRPTKPSRRMSGKSVRRCYRQTGHGGFPASHRNRLDRYLRPGRPDRKTGFPGAPIAFDRTAFGDLHFLHAPGQFAASSPTLPSAGRTRNFCTNPRKPTARWSKTSTTSFTPPIKMARSPMSVPFSRRSWGMPLQS